MPIGNPIVYWSGTEDIDVLITGPNAASANSGCDPQFVRCAVGSNGQGSVAVPLVSSVSNPLSFGNLSSFWYHANVIISGLNTSANCNGFAFTDNAGVVRLLLRGTGTNGQWKLSTRNAASTITDVPGASAVIPFPANALFKIDMFVNYSTSGQFTLYCNGAVALDTGPGVNITTDGATSLSFFQIGNFYTGSSFGHWHSEIIVADSDTRAARIWQMNSSTAGNTDQWTGALANVNKALVSDTTYVTAATAGLIQEYKTGGIVFPSGNFSVVAVKMTARALVGVTGPQHIQYVTRVGTTDYLGSTWTPFAPGSFYNDAPYNAPYVQTTNPATGVAWTVADITAATFNYGFQSVA